MVPDEVSESAERRFAIGMAETFATSRGFDSWDHGRDALIRMGAVRVLRPLGKHAIGVIALGHDDPFG